MRTLNCGINRLGRPRTGRAGCQRAFTPLIEICDSTSQIKLDLGACDPCTAKPTALLLRRAGCEEYETICEEVEAEVCCGVIDSRWGVRAGDTSGHIRPHSRIIKRSVPKPKPSVLYPLHEIDPQGMSVFVLDGKLKELGYGRYNAVVMVDNCETELTFDVDYICGRIGIGAIETERLQPNLEEC